MNPLRYVLLAAMASAVAACSGGPAPFCGDGELDEGEQCDDGNSDDTDFCLSDCTARQLSSLTVKWEFNRGAAEGFTGDSCIDLGASRVEVVARTGVQEFTLDESCSLRQVVFVDIPPGSYDLELRVLSAGGEVIVNSPIEASLEFGGNVDELVVDVPPDAWTRDYLGTLFFRLSWGGQDCALATPPVAEQRVTLTAGGSVFTGATIDGAKLDGSEPFGCVSIDEEFPQSALDVPFGEATLLVEGLDGTGATVFEQSYDTFIGAGVNNPELVFDVAPVGP